MSKVICKYCKKEFESFTGRAKYCSKKCMNNSYSRKVKLNIAGKNNKPITCLRCGKIFYVSESRLNYAILNNFEIKYCSKKCKNICGIEHAADYCKFNIEKTCPICGNLFLVRQYDLDKGNGICCSRKCGGIYRRKNITIICEVCGKEFNSYPCRVGIRRFCSRKCQHISITKPKSEVSTIERKRGASKEWTKAIYLRDNWTCQKCGKRGGELNAHHIIPYSVDETLRNELSNGITLCKNCHKLEHNRLKNLSAEQLDIFSPKKRNYSKRR